MMNMQWIAKDCLVVAPAGSLDAIGADLLLDATSEQLEGKPAADLYINLAKVPYIGTAGLDALLTLLRLTKARNRRMVLVGLRTQGYLIFDLVGATGLFEFGSAPRKNLHLLAMPGGKGARRPEFVAG